ncbi:MAG TPA: hypothetical protein QGF05_03955 [Dehalococcoidia bacterium]|nr:hypothetical protein [Dehalococcoidia bacterium]
MHRVLAQGLDALVLRWTARRAQLGKRTLWPDPDLVTSLRSGAFPPLDFSDPGPPTQVAVAPAPRNRLRRNGPDYHFHFPSTPTPALDHDTEVHGDLYLPSGGIRGATVVFPGAFTGANFGTELPVYDKVCRTFARGGIVAALIDPPLHRRRTAPGVQSGHDLLHGDLFPYARGVAQAVRDVQATIGWLEANYGPTGLWGLSLGGLVASLVVVRDPRLAFAVLVQPPLGHEHAMESALTKQWLLQLRESGVTEDDIAAIFRMLRTREAPAIGREKILIQAGRWDTVSSPAGIEEVWRAWGEPRLSWYEHSHTSIFLAANQWVAEGVSFSLSAMT